MSGGSQRNTASTRQLTLRRVGGARRGRPTLQGRALNANSSNEPEDRVAACQRGLSGPSSVSTIGQVEQDNIRLFSCPIENDFATVRRYVEVADGQLATESGRL